MMKAAMRLMKEPMTKVETTFLEKSGAPQLFCQAQGHALEKPYDLIIAIYSEMFFDFPLSENVIILGYLKDRNAATHCVDSDIF